MLGNPRLTSGIAGPLHVLKQVCKKATLKAFPSVRGCELGSVCLSHWKSSADYQYNDPLKLSSVIKQSPQDIATAVVRAVKEEAGPIVSAASVNERGSVDIVLDNTWLAHLADRISELTKDDALENPRAKNVLIDYASPNMAKELHVGHLRSTIIGDALGNLLEYRGHKVNRISHVGDFGTPMGMVLAHFMDSRVSPKDPSIVLSDVYRKAKAKFDQSSQFAQKATQVAAQLQGGERAPSQVKQLYAAVCERSRKSFEEIYERLGITGLKELGESHYSAMLPSLLDELLSSAIATHKNGAVCVEFPGVKGLPDTPCILRKQNGAYLYSATDLAALKHRVLQLSMDRIIYVVDSSQSVHFAQIFEVGKRAGWLREGVQAVHAPVGMMLGEDNKKLSSREGNSLDLAAFLDEAVKHTASVVANLDGNRNDLDVDQVTASIGYGAVKYYDLAQHRKSDYRFSFDKMLNMKGNTAVYVLYARTRINSLLSKAKARGIAMNHHHHHHHHHHGGKCSYTPVYPEERDLLLSVSQFPDVLAEVEEHLSPHILCTYLHKISTKFHSFYEQHQVLRSDHAPQLVRTCAQLGNVLDKGLRLLGLSPLDKM